MFVANEDPCFGLLDIYIYIYGRGRGDLEDGAIVIESYGQRELKMKRNGLKANYNIYIYRR